MKNIILFDTKTSRLNLLPFSYTRPISDIRVGIYTNAEKWINHFGFQIAYCTEDYLQQKYSPVNSKYQLYILGNICPNKELLQEINLLVDNTKLVSNNQVIAFKTALDITFDTLETQIANFQQIDANANFNQIQYPWDIFKINGAEIKSDYEFIVQNSTSEPMNDKATICYNESQIFIEKGAKIKAAVLNAENGPIYIGKNTEIQEGALIRGPFALCEGSTVNMGAKIKGDTTIGPHSKVGGEISNSVIFGFTNKGHDGFLGNSVLGEWCNIGADSNTSNLKNNYAEVRLWNYGKQGFQKTGLQFCGLIMGDHSKCGINTMFNTGTVVGVNANIFGSGFPRNFVPSYSWGGASGFETYTTKKAFEVAAVVMQRRGLELTDVDKNILEEVFERSNEYRIWDKK